MDKACGDQITLRSRVEELLSNDVLAEQGRFLSPRSLNLRASLEGSVNSIVGRTIGSFKAIKKIGEGGMGEVYLAKRNDDYEQEVAIKILRPMRCDDETIRRFKSEAQFTASLGAHPHVATLIEAGRTDDGLFYLVTDYVDGIRIDAYCDEAKLSVDDRLRIFIRTCDAIQCAHQRAIIHRDIKPSNIFVSPDGEVTLIDFGIAKVATSQLDASAEKTQTIYRILTPEYASPEQARGEAATTATDIYSLGVVLHRLVVGSNPYAIDPTDSLRLAEEIEKAEVTQPGAAIGKLMGDAEASARVSQNRCTSIAKLKRQLEGDLGTILLMALREDPNRRYASVDQFAGDIQNYSAGRYELARIRSDIERSNS